MTRRLFSRLVMALLGAPALAHAACPTGADLDANGIVLTVDGEVEVHTRAPNGTIVVLTEPDADGYIYRSILAHGVHVLQLADLKNGAVVPGSLWRFAFPMGPTELPAPTPNGTFKAKTTSLADGIAEVEVVSHTWGAEGTYTIGACSYRAIPVRVDFDGEDYDHVEELIYFPTLGTAILTRYSDSEGDDQYTYTDIAAQ